MMGLGGSMPSLNLRQGLMNSAMNDPMNSGGGQDMGGQLAPSGGMDTMFGIKKQNQMLGSMAGPGASMNNPFGGGSGWGM